MSRNSKPLELPGLYWDEERRRYFPLSSRPKRKVLEDEPVVETFDEGRGQRVLKPSTAWCYVKEMRTGRRTFSGSSQIIHALMGKSLSASYVELDPPIRPLSWYTSSITALHAATIDGTLNLLAGDSRGFLYYSRAEVQQLDSEPDKFNDNLRLFTSYYLGSGIAVSHVVRSGYTAVAVSSTYDSCQLCVRDLKAPDDDGIFFPRINVIGDIWAASLLDKTLTLGLSRKLVFVKDIGSGSIKSYTTIRTKSDVLSIFQRQNTIIAGSRNGDVRLFDIRVRGDTGMEILGGRFAADRNRHAKARLDIKSAHSAVTHLQGIREWELLVATSAGELEMFDLRFSTGNCSEPTMVFPGHVNSYLLDLGITTDASANFLFAAGQDRRVRGWSLRTGRPLGSGALLGGVQLQSPAHALQLTEDPMRLWIAQSEEVRVCHLGAREGDE